MRLVARREAWFAGSMTELAMFPLGSVLFPHMPVLLRVFEDRYLIMLSRILKEEPAEFGIVLIERGQEVGGGEQRFAVGTVARIAQLETTPELVGLVAEGDRRIEVVEWLEDDPYPRATIRVLDDLVWDDALAPLRERAEQTVRRVLAVASEYSDQQWSATVELADDPVAAAWQLAAIAPLGPMDQVQLLRSPTMGALLGSLIDLTLAAEEMLRDTFDDDADSDWPEG
jgi:Lon protease-like protein